MLFLKLVLRNLMRHWLRSLLTVGSLVVALFLLCVLRSLVTTLEAGIENTSSRRLVVQSAVSLFVELPLSYQAKIEAVPGIERTCKWQWFGGFYQEERNQFGQFAVDQETVFQMFPEVEIIEGSAESWTDNRRGCLIGDGLADRFGWKVGDTVPLMPMNFPHPDGNDVAWEFEVSAIYRPTAKNFDRHTFFFHWDYFEKTLEGGSFDSPGISTIYIETTPGVEQTTVMARIDELFENGPQRVQTTPESEFLAQFVSMFGNVPFFVSSIGSAVLIAILLACVNTMLMAGREQLHDIGIQKALGFTDGRMFALLIVQALALCGLGGLGGVGLSLLTQNGIAEGMGTVFPGFAIQQQTTVLGLVATLVLGLVSGIVPAFQASRLKCVDALGTEN